jgi:hypothetical protein
VARFRLTWRKRGKSAASWWNGRLPGRKEVELPPPQDPVWLAQNKEIAPMADKKTPKDKSPAEVLSELMNVPFPNAAYVEAMKRVFSMQKHMLDSFQTNLDQWFERRRQGTEATLNMLHAINGESDQEKRAEAWQRWVSGTMARIMDDVQTQFDTMAKITGQLAEKGEITMPGDLKSVKTRPVNGKTEPHGTAPKKVQPRVKAGTNGVRASH